MELFRMLPTTEPNDLNTDCLDIPVGPLSDEIVGIFYVCNMFILNKDSCVVITFSV